jgi:hypothetical protein
MSRCVLAATPISGSQPPNQALERPRCSGDAGTPRAAQKAGIEGRPVERIHLVQRALLSARFPWSAPFDNQRTRSFAYVASPPPQIGQRRHVPWGAPFSAAHEMADGGYPPTSRKQGVDRTCRLRRFRGCRATGCRERSVRTSSEGALSGSALREGRDQGSWSPQTHISVLKYGCNISDPGPLEAG